ncbi:expressed unknown protein [Seminavis robusta]|uniref:Uncharacterized protein n=1 Tax=Seminavis robusta TaxID=568900 RepID=A0A9N8H384_9STRA|nr:expressed unknown protein [Seminavis robusta]|eukprot:Sro21_g014910.1 n/a (768) ;mRNA; r:135331-137634
MSHLHCQRLTGHPTGGPPDETQAGQIKSSLLWAALHELSTGNDSINIAPMMASRHDVCAVMPTTQDDQKMPAQQETPSHATPSESSMSSLSADDNIIVPKWSSSAKKVPTKPDPQAKIQATLQKRMRRRRRNATGTSKSLLQLPPEEVPKGETKQERKRRLGRVHARRKRVKDNIIMDCYTKEFQRLSAANEVIRRENQKVQEFLERAQNMHSLLTARDSSDDTGTTQQQPEGQLSAQPQVPQPCAQHWPQPQQVAPQSGAPLPPSQPQAPQQVNVFFAPSQPPLQTAHQAPCAQLPQLSTNVAVPQPQLNASCAPHQSQLQIPQVQQKALCVQQQPQRQEASQTWVQQAANAGYHQQRQASSGTGVLAMTQQQQPSASFQPQASSISGQVAASNQGLVMVNAPGTLANPPLVINGPGMLANPPLHPPSHTIQSTVYHAPSQPQQTVPSHPNAADMGHDQVVQQLATVLMQVMQNPTSSACTNLSPTNAVAQAPELALPALMPSPPSSHMHQQAPGNVLHAMPAQSQFQPPSSVHPMHQQPQCGSINGIAHAMNAPSINAVHGVAQNQANHVALSQGGQIPTVYVSTTTTVPPPPTIGIDGVQQVLSAAMPLFVQPHAVGSQQATPTGPLANGMTMNASNVGAEGNGDSQAAAVHLVCQLLRSQHPAAIAMAMQIFATMQQATGPQLAVSYTAPLPSPSNTAPVVPAPVVLASNVNAQSNDDPQGAVVHLVCQLLQTGQPAATAMASQILESMQNRSSDQDPNLMIA